LPAFDELAFGILVLDRDAPVGLDQLYVMFVPSAVALKLIVSPAHTVIFGAWRFSTLGVRTATVTVSVSMAVHVLVPKVRVEVAITI
jgi:hypothetical protein